jgi:hypothetical protein
MANVSLDSLVFTPVVADLVPTGASQDDAFLISSDDESDYDSPDEDQSDTSFPTISELRLAAGRGDGKSSSIASGMYLNSPSLGESLR